MAVASKTRNMLENLVREGSFKWLIGNRSPFDDELEEMDRSPSAPTNWIPELSPIANVVVRRCSKILGVPTTELCKGFSAEASESIKHPSRYARNFLEYCSFRALALSTQVTGHLADKKFRRLTYDMMLAWEAPASDSQPLLNLNEDLSVGIEAFSRIAPSVPIIANVIISENLFEVLATSTGGRLQFSTYDKYLSGLERAIRKMRTQSESSLLSAVRSSRGERILEVDGTVTTQPVLEHVGISTWPGRLILTDHALYFEALRVVSYDKAKRYDLSDDLKQVVKPELTGPWGTRLFDKAVFYKSISLSEPVVIEFPELKGHSRSTIKRALAPPVLLQIVNVFQKLARKKHQRFARIPVMATKVYIVYYSMYGHVEKLAEEIKKGAASVEGVEATLWQVPETLQDEVLGKMSAPPKSDAPIITPNELADADGFVFGFPTRFGMMAAQFKAFLDATGGLWRTQQLAGKPAGIFYSTGSQGGGQETTALTAITQLVHHGMIFVPIGYTFGAGMFEMENIKGGSPYGAGTFAGDGSRQPTKLELEQAFHQGKYIATITKKLKGAAA